LAIGAVFSRTFVSNSPMPAIRANQATNDSATKVRNLPGSTSECERSARPCTALSEAVFNGFLHNGRLDDGHLYHLRADDIRLHDWGLDHSAYRPGALDDDGATPANRR